MTMYQPRHVMHFRAQSRGILVWSSCKICKRDGDCTQVHDGDDPPHKEEIHAERDSGK